MWTPATRRQHSRAGLRYASDLTDDEWRILEPLLPGAPRRGRRRAWPLREIANAIFYVLRAGCTWRLLPDSFPPWRTVYRWFARLRDGGVFEAINHHLVMLDRERAGREASPTAAVIDSQSVKTTESGGPRGYDAEKKIRACTQLTWERSGDAPCQTAEDGPCRACSAEQRAVGGDRAAPADGAYGATVRGRSAGDQRHHPPVARRLPMAGLPPEYGPYTTVFNRWNRWSPAQALAAHLRCPRRLR